MTSLMISNRIYSFEREKGRPGVDEFKTDCFEMTSPRCKINFSLAAKKTIIKKDVNLLR